MAEMHNNGSKVIHAHISNSDYEHPCMDGYCKNHLHCRVQLKDDIEATEKNIQFWNKISI